MASIWTDFHRAHESATRRAALRSKFAAAALTGILNSYGRDPLSVGGAAELSFDYADAMLTLAETYLMRELPIQPEE